MKLHLCWSLLFAAALAYRAPSRAEAQVFVGGPGYGTGVGFAGSGFAGTGLAVGTIGPDGYNYAYGSPWGASFYSSSYYGAPFVGYGPGAYGYGFNYSPYFYGRYRGFALPPIVIPAETIYGPGAVQRFLGVDQTFATPTSYTLPAANVGAVPGGGFGVLAPGAQVPKANVVASNDAARERAKKQLAIGDDWFRKQQYGNAASAYRDAIRAAPDVADAYFHQAAIAIAQNRYEAAVDGIKSGLKISTTYIDGGFKYSTLYGENKLARIAHLEALAQEATANPSADLYFLMGVMLFFDEQPRRSGPFFTKAKELAVGETWHIDVFGELLRKLDAEAAEKAMAAGQVGNAAPVGPPPAAHPPAAAQPAAQPEKAQPQVGVEGREI